MSSRIPSPLETPPPPQFSPTLPTEGANDNGSDDYHGDDDYHVNDDVGASPEFKSAPTKTSTAPVNDDVGVSPEFKSAPTTKTSTAPVMSSTPDVLKSSSLESSYTPDQAPAVPPLMPTNIRTALTEIQAKHAPSPQVGYNKA